VGTTQAIGGVALKLYLKSLAFLVLVPGTVLGVGPFLIHLTDVGRLALGPARWLGLALVVPGAVLLLWCFHLFVAVGRGMPAPIDAPTVFVAEGPYRVVRNPMYVAVVALVSGEAVIYQHVLILAYALVLWLGFNAFVCLNEEPRLQKRFGASYEAYVARVPRWIPRFG